MGLPCRLQTLRVLQGRPYPDQELTLEVTPLEAGLWHTVSFTKGCYLGQETIAKVGESERWHRQPRVRGLHVILASCFRHA